MTALSLKRSRLPRRRSDPRATPVHERPGFDFSITGLVYSSLMMFMGLSAINTQASLLFGVFGLMLGILFVSGVISRTMLVRIELRRVLPDQAVVGQAVVVQYLISNHKPFWPSMSLTISELDVQGLMSQPHVYVLHTAAKTTSGVAAELTPKRRGLQRFSRYQIATSFPFGFIKRALNRDTADALLVFPPIASVDADLLQQFRSAETSGENLKPVEGGMDEFFGLKEYRSGESPRFIYWKRSAKTGQLVSRQMTHVAPGRLVIMVDTFQPDDAEATIAGVERVIAQAGSLIDGALAAGLAVGLVCRMQDWLFVPPARGKQHRRELLSLLARLGPNRDQSPEKLLEEASRHVDPGATPVLMTRGGVSTTGATRRRGSAIVVGCESPQAQGWFKFDPSIDFASVAPLVRPTR
jgi:uncharacterized protein (DUF58 family)